MDAIFPSYISIWYKASKRPLWNPQIRKSVSGVRRSLLFYSSPIWEISLPIGHLYPADMEILAGFFNRLSGPHETFYFFDPMNVQTEVVIGTGDGSETEFQLYRAWGYDDLYTEYPQYPETYVDSSGYGVDGYITPDITGFGVPVPPLPEVYIDGVLQTDGYSLTSAGKLVFDTAPGIGEEVTATFYFCYKVAFAENTDFIQEFYNGWSTALKLETIV